MTQPYLGVPVVVTTEHKTVFFGYLIGSPNKDVITLHRARNCVYWDRDVKGLVGLAATGPTDTCRITASVESATLFDITSVLGCSPEAVKAWEAAPWSS